MSFVNYWDQLSGDSQASPWNQQNWANGPQGSGNGGGNMYSAPGQAQQVPGAGQQSLSNLWKSAQGDANKQDIKYGGYATSAGHGQGYWSGGRPGSGSWVEPWVEAAQAATPAEPLKPGTVAPVTNDMVPGAGAQTPARTAPQADAMSHWDTPYAGRYQVVNQMYDQYLDRDAEDGGWQGWENTIDAWFRQGMTGDQINQRIAQEFQNSDEYRQRTAAGLPGSYSR